MKPHAQISAQHFKARVPLEKIEPGVPYPAELVSHYKVCITYQDGSKIERKFNKVEPPAKKPYWFLVEYRTGATMTINPAGNVVTVEAEPQYKEILVLKKEDGTFWEMA